MKMSAVQKEDIHLSSGSMREHVDADEMGINALNDDCLMHIIQYLPIADRVRIERVSKRWLTISLNSWHSFQKLKFENECWGLSKPDALAKVNRRIFKKILSRCGKFLTSMEFSDFNENLGPGVLKTVATFCPNIQNLGASCLEVSPRSLKILSKKCNKLVHFAVGSCTDKCDYELSLLFANNRQLKSLCVHSNFEISGECLKELNCNSIVSIIFTSCPWIELDNFHVVRHFRKLEQLVLEHYLVSNNDIVKDIISDCKSLKYLSLTVADSYLDSLQLLSNLTNLQSLDLSSNHTIANKVLISIGASCKLLKQLNISYCDGVTNAGLAGIVTLPNLESLIIRGLDSIDDQIFCPMPALRQLDCSYCANMGDTGLAKLVETSENMEHLYLYLCYDVTNELLEAAIKATAKRTNQVVLKLYLSNTSVQLSKTSGSSPFLRVIPMISVTDTLGLSTIIFAPRGRFLPTLIK